MRCDACVLNGLFYKSTDRRPFIAKHKCKILFENHFFSSLVLSLSSCRRLSVWWVCVCGLVWKLKLLLCSIVSITVKGFYENVAFTIECIWYCKKKIENKMNCGKKGFIACMRRRPFIYIYIFFSHRYFVVDPKFPKQFSKNIEGSTHN